MIRTREFARLVIAGGLACWMTSLAAAAINNGDFEAPLTAADWTPSGDADRRGDPTNAGNNVGSALTKNVGGVETVGSLSQTFECPGTASMICRVTFDYYSDNAAALVGMANGANLIGTNGQWFRNQQINVGPCNQNNTITFKSQLGFRIYVDNVKSACVVPEPGSLLLVASGVGPLAIRRGRRGR